MMEMIAGRELNSLNGAQSRPPPSHEGGGREERRRRRVGANDDTKEGRFDSTKFSEAFSFRKVGAIELLRCCVIHCK